jgi:alpha-beta hydrolase superfamily lysophospholipase
MESEFNSYDGETLFYRYTKPVTNSKKALLFLHRGHEHSGRIIPFANKLSEDDHWCFAFDMRGHGLSGGRRAWADNFDAWVRDLNSFAGHIRQTFGIEINNTILVANSVGAVMAVRWILNYGANLRGCILGAPAFSIKLYIPFALPLLRLARRISRDLFVTSYVRSSLLTRDEKEALSYDTDPLITNKIGVNVLVTLFDAVRNCFARLRDFEVPVLIFTAEKDYIVRNKHHALFYKHISSTLKKHILLKDFRHAIFHEKDQHLILEPSRKFVNNLFEEDSKQLPATIPLACTHTVQEFQKLYNTGSLPKQIYYSIFRRLFEKLGQYSNGISIGLQFGFDSGVSLDYVYKNKPAGQNTFGRLIDRIYLNSVGWQGIRKRKQHLIEALMAVSNELSKNSKQPVIFDAASGPGRYLFEIQQQLDYPIQLYLNDEDKTCIEHAQQIAAHYKSNTTAFFNQNVFDDFKSRMFSTTPNIIIISGLFELYDNNGQVHQVINNLYSLLDEGGYLIYTGQPWHPQMELIGRLLNNRLGQRWVMRRRIQREMDGLVESAGFTKLSTESDDFGIFTVSCAYKQNTHYYKERDDGRIQQRA